MISVIIVSTRSPNYQSIIENISLTIGVAYELIHVDQLEKGICFAYNLGAARAKFSILCFVHDDVLFHSIDWGKKIGAHLKNQTTGVIGVMGGRYKSANGLGWRDGYSTMYRYQVKDGAEAGKHLLYNPFDEEKSRVLCVDGALLCCRKEVWQQFPFDEITFTGFHFYDIDFCVQVNIKYINYVIYDVLIEHFSQGKKDEAFLKSVLEFEQKWKDSLPLSLEPLTPKKTMQLEGYALTERLIQMKRTGYKKRERWKLIKKYFRKYRNIYHLIHSSYFGILK